MILRQLERVSRTTGIDRLIVATSTDPSDDRLAEICTQEGIACFRGQLDDVLDRFYQAALPYRPDHVIRLTADCPLADPALIDRLVDFFLERGDDYASNCLEPTYPDGLDAEIFRFSCLEQAWQEASLTSHREHVTPFMYQNPGRFRIGCLKNDSDLSSLRWTVDEPSDFELIRRIYECLYPQNPCFTTQDILALLDRAPELTAINAGITRNEGFLKSLSG